MTRNIIILGSGRSGTTWLHDVSSSHANIRRIFEPLHPLQVKSAAKFAGLHLKATSRNKDLYKYLNEVFYDRTHDAWLRWLHLGITKDTNPSRKAWQFGYNLPRYKFWAKNRSVKFIQANLMTKWLANSFPHPIIFMIRNPYNVIRSQLNMGWPHNTINYTRQESIREYLEEKNILEFVLSSTSLVEKLTIRWCIENVLAIEEGALNHENIIAIKYETLTENEKVFQLLSHIGYSEEETAKIKKGYQLQEKVRSTKRKSTRGDGLNQNQLHDIGNVLRMFKVDSYQSLTSDFDKIFK